MGFGMNNPYPPPPPQKENRHKPFDRPMVQYSLTPTLFLSFSLSGRGRRAADARLVRQAFGGPAGLAAC